MASSDLLTRIRAELDARLRELRPLLSEYERLLAAEAVLGDSRPPARTPIRRSASAPARTPAARGRRTPAPTPAPPVATPASASAAPARRRGRPPGRPPGRPRAAAGGAAPKQRARGAAAAAILAALEHGSHTVSELVVVTAIGAPIIHNNLGRLRQAGTVTRVKRAGDGKSAYALA